MYAAHLAAGLALKAAVPKAPAWALLGGAFLPDFAWIALAGAGVEPADPAVFFDGWSHSLVSILAQATVFALLFWRSDWTVRLSIWCAVASHFLLDFLIHPKPLELYPHARVRLGWDLWKWGEQKLWLGFSHYWWIQLAITVVLLGVYLALRKRGRIAPNLAAASVIAVLGLHFLL